MNLTPGFLNTILSAWGLRLECARPEIPIQGSPERCLDRVVVRAGGADWLLEELDAGSVSRKAVIAARLTHLSSRGLPVAAPLHGKDGASIQHAHGRHWQLSPFLDGVPLDRGTYWRDAWRGETLARYLADMRRAARDMDLNEPSFDLRAYARRIETDARRLHPQIHGRLAAIFSLLDRSLNACGDLPKVFCHGDPHPLNVIWGEDRILAAIDWEFCGPKCALHDMALVLGCVGSEDEEALDGAFARAFLDTARNEGLLDAELEAHLPTWTLALRTAWLAEWLRRGDMEMAEFEMFYMEILADRIQGAGAGFSLRNL
ncbi:phosphotransferase enzyme family protein [Desulfomicrobium salsuginis]